MAGSLLDPPQLASIPSIQSIHCFSSLTDQMRNAVDSSHGAGGEGFAHIAIGLRLAVGAEVFVVDGTILQPAGGSGLGIQRDQELPVAAIEVQKEGPLMQDRRGPGPPEVVALEVAALPQLLAGARIQASGARFAERYINSAFFNDRSGRGVAVVAFPEIRLLRLKDQNVVNHLPGISVEAQSIQTAAVVGRRGDPNLVSPNDRR